MKLAGLTWWRNNYGSILQAYALQQELNTYPNVEYEIINQFGRRIASADNLLDKLKTFGLLKTFQRIFWKFAICPLRQRSNNLQRFVDEKLVLSFIQYTENTITEANKNYDGFVCGSDQIWNPTLTTTDSMYWLSFADDSKIRIAYAPSIGVDKVSENDRITIVNNLKRFTGISCRENSGTELINDILKENKCVTVLDPTMLVERRIWDEICPGRRFQEPYIFVYMLRGSKEQRKMVERFAYKKNLKIITMPFLETEHTVWYDFKFGDVKYWDAAPDEFISAIRYADYVFTDSFHSIVFSCLYHVPFLIFPKTGKAQMSRIMELQELLEVGNRMTNSDTEINNKADMGINWEKVDSILESNRKDSKNYLRKAIGLNDERICL